MMVKVSTDGAPPRYGHGAYFADNIDKANKKADNIDNGKKKAGSIETSSSAGRPLERDDGSNVRVDSLTRSFTPLTLTLQEQVEDLGSTLNTIERLNIESLWSLLSFLLLLKQKR